MKLISLTNSNEISTDDNCTSATLRMYNYVQENRVQLNQMVCSEARIKTDANRGVVTSSLNDGSFLLEVKSIKKRSLTEVDIFGMEPPITGARDFFNSEPLIPVAGPFTGWNPTRAVPVQTFYTRPSVQAPYHGKPTPLIDITYNFTAPSGTIISSTTNISTSSNGSITQETFTEVPSVTTTEITPTTGEGSTTFVEIVISNSTEAKTSRKIRN